MDAREQVELPQLYQGEYSIGELTAAAAAVVVITGILPEVVPLEEVRTKKSPRHGRGRHQPKKKEAAP